MIRRLRGTTEESVLGEKLRAQLSHFDQKLKGTYDGIGLSTMDRQVMRKEKKAKGTL